MATPNPAGAGVASEVERLDHGLLNIPLAKRGNIDAQIDRYKAQQARERREADAASFRSVRAKKARIAEILAQLSDERVLQLAKPLGARKAVTARAKLLSAASANYDRWLGSLEREIAPFPPGGCAKCRAPFGGCDCTPSEWLGK